MAADLVPSRLASGRIGVGALLEVRDGTSVVVNSAGDESQREEFLCLTIRWEGGRPVYDLGGFEDWAAIGILMATANAIESRCLGPRAEGEVDEAEDVDEG